MNDMIMFQTMHLTAAGIGGFFFYRYFCSYLILIELGDGGFSLEIARRQY